MNTTHQLNWIRTIQILLVTLVLTSASPGRAQDYLGASNVLYQVQERNTKPATANTNDASALLREDLKTFRQSMTNLAPADAVRGWLALVDRAVKLQRQLAQNYNPSGIPIRAEDVIEVLPPPAAWDKLAKAIQARPPAKSDGELQEVGLHLLAATLTGDTAGRNREIANL